MVWFLLWCVAMLAFVVIALRFQKVWSDNKRLVLDVKLLEYSAREENKLVNRPQVKFKVNVQATSPTFGLVSDDLITFSEGDNPLLRMIAAPRDNLGRVDIIVRLSQVGNDTEMMPLYGKLSHD